MNKIFEIKEKGTNNSIQLKYIREELLSEIVGLKYNDKNYKVIAGVDIENAKKYGDSYTFILDNKKITDRNKIEELHEIVEKILKEDRED